MKTNWRIEDYRDLYNERAGIMEFDGGEIHNQANLQAWNEIFKLFMQMNARMMMRLLSLKGVCQKETIRNNC